MTDWSGFILHRREAGSDCEQASVQVSFGGKTILQYTIIIKNLLRMYWMASVT